MKIPSKIEEYLLDPLQLQMMALMVHSTNSAYSGRRDESLALIITSYATFDKITDKI